LSYFSAVGGGINRQRSSRQLGAQLGGAAALGSNKSARVSRRS